MEIKKDEITYLHFTIFDVDGITPLSAQSGSCTESLMFNDQTGTEAVAIHEINSLGYYYASFTPTKTGIYDLEITCPDGAVNGSSFKCQLLNTNDIASGVWEEILVGGTHNTPASAGRRLRTSFGQSITDGTTVSATFNTITLNGDASSDDGAYDPAMISIVGGTGFGQTRGIFEYDGATKTAVVDRNWKVLPNDTSEYLISAWVGREHVNEGLARGGDTNTITLNILASDEDNTYVGQVVFIRSGVGEDQVAHVIGYNGTTKIATIEHEWSVIPDTTSAYIMLPNHVHLISCIADGMWDEPIQEHLTGGSMGDGFNRILGLNYENAVYEYHWQGDSNYNTDIYVYDSKTNASGHDMISGLIGHYAMTGTFTGNKPNLVKFFKVE